MVPGHLRGKFWLAGGRVGVQCRVRSFEGVEMAFRQLRKVEALSSETDHVYECDACIWVVHVSPERHPAEIQMEFDRHDCKEYSMNQRRCE